MQKARRHSRNSPPPRKSRGLIRPIGPISPIISMAEGWTSRAPTACRHVVSGSLSSPNRGSSHLSLALLGSLSVAREYLALRDGPRRFKPAFTCPVLLRYQLVHFPLPLTGLSPSMVEHSRTVLLGYSLSKCRPYNPTRTSPGGLG